MGKQSYISDKENFYEGDISEKPKLDHLNFIENPNYDLTHESSTEDVIQFFRTNEKKIIDPWPQSRSGKKSPNTDQCNKLLSIIHNKFPHHNLIVIYNEIVEYFNLDFVKFYNNLGKHIQDKLMLQLKKNINLDTYQRIKMKEEISHGGWQPTIQSISNQNTLGSSDVAGSSGT